MSRRTATIVVIFLSMLWVFPSAVTAQNYPSFDETPPVERTGEGDVAVIVAVEDYAFLPDVEGAIANGNDWEVFFERALGVSTIHFLADRNATNTEMRRFAETAVEDVDEGATVWFVFIGHGAPAEGGEDGILVGMDARQNPASLESRGIRQQELMEILEEGPQARTVAVVDACFSGRDTDGEALVEAQPVVPSDVEPDIEETSTVVMSAAQAEEFAGPLPGADRPAFSYLLLGALRGWADDGTGSVTADSALNYTRRVLRGIPGRFQQTPDLHGDNELVLARGVEESDPGIGDALRQGIEREQAPEPESSEPHRDHEPEARSSSSQTECPYGQVRNADTHGHCCYPGQVWDDQRRECIGTPSECPDEAEVDRSDETCALEPCDDGQVRVEEGAPCCWPGQRWSRVNARCVGTPDSCPDGHGASGNDCERCPGGSFVSDNKCERVEGWSFIRPGSFEQPTSDRRDRSVTISKPFFLQDTPVTQAEWQEVMGTNPSLFTACGDECPVENVNWWQVLVYLNRLSKQDELEQCYELSNCVGDPGDSDFECEDVDFAGLECRGYRLPTEAEWGYAARGEASGERYGRIDDIAWYLGNSNRTTHPVGQRKSNYWGVYDMFGNVEEWTWDGYDAYETGDVTDPTGSQEASNRSIRGCSWNDTTSQCKSSERGRLAPDESRPTLGFRPARTDSSPGNIP